MFCSSIVTVVAELALKMGRIFDLDGHVGNVVFFLDEAMRFIKSK